MTTQSYTLTEELRAELHETLLQVYEGCQNITGPEIPLERLIKIFKDPIVEKDEKPLWRTGAFTDEDRAMMLNMMMEEADAKGWAIDTLDEETSLAELIGYADMDPDVTSRILLHSDPRNDVELAEIEDEVAEAGEDAFSKHIDFSIRMGLIADGKVTALGKEYMEIHL